MKNKCKTLTNKWKSEEVKIYNEEATGTKQIKIKTNEKKVLKLKGIK